MVQFDADRLHRQVAEYEQDIIDFTRRIVQTPSLPCEEGPVIELISNEMKKVGFDEVWTDSMGNLIGRIGSGDMKLMIDAHLDTVGVGDKDAWAIDPFEGKFEDGKIFGRGATDQKAAMGAMVYGGKLIKDLGLDGDYTLYVVGSVQEEDCDGLPLLHLIEKEGLRPDYVILTEATNMNVYRGHRGRMEMTVETKGRSCHGSAPERGVNAIYKMAGIIADIEKLNDRLAHDDFLGKGTICVSCIECDTPSLCAVPDRCVIYLDRRLTVGETKDIALAEVRELPSVKAAEATVELLEYKATSWKGLEVAQEKYFPTWVTEPDHELVRAGVEAGRVALQREPNVDKWVFSTNGVGPGGKLGIPCLGFGPANEIYAHTVDEFVTVDDLKRCAVFYATVPLALVETRQAAGQA